VRRFDSFAEFNPFYLTEHSRTGCRWLHFIGTSLAIGCVLAFVLTFNAYWLLGALWAGYGFAWLGHALIERNRPATFQHPFYSLLGDFAMYRDMLAGRIPF
jgi:hypothetical protein